MRTEDHVDHDNGLNEQDDGDDDGRNDDNTTINCWRRFWGVDTRERDELGRRWVEFSFEDEDDVDRIDDGTMGRTAATMTAATTTTRIKISTMQAPNTTTTMTTATATMAIVMKTMVSAGTRTNQQSTTARRQQ
jgi:hypothetical protein